jgi:hypothetical protein
MNFATRKIIMKRVISHRSFRKLFLYFYFNPFDILVFYFNPFWQLGSWVNSFSLKNKLLGGARFAPLPPFFVLTLFGYEFEK